MPTFYVSWQRYKQTANKFFVSGLCKWSDHGRAFLSLITGTDGQVDGHTGRQVEKQTQTGWRAER